MIDGVTRTYEEQPEPTAEERQQAWDLFRTYAGQLMTHYAIAPHDSLLLDVPCSTIQDGVLKYGTVDIELMPLGGEDYMLTMDMPGMDGDSYEYGLGSDVSDHQPPTLYRQDIVTPDRVRNRKPELTLAELHADDDPKLYYPVHPGEVDDLFTCLAKYAKPTVFEADAELHETNEGGAPDEVGAADELAS